MKLTAKNECRRTNHKQSQKTQPHSTVLGAQTLCTHVQPIAQPAVLELLAPYCWQQRSALACFTQAHACDKLGPRPPAEPWPDLKQGIQKPKLLQAYYTPDGRHASAWYNVPMIDCEHEHAALRWRCMNTSKSCACLLPVTLVPRSPHPTAIQPPA